MGGLHPHSSIETFVGSKSNAIGLPFMLRDYLELVDWTARIIRDDKRGFMSNKTPPILERLNLPNKGWMVLSSNFERHSRLRVNAQMIQRRITKIAALPT